MTLHEWAEWLIERNAKPMQPFFIDWRLTEEGKRELEGACNSAPLSGLARHQGNEP